MEMCGRIIGSAISVHTALGPGLLESAHEHCLERELILNGLLVERQKTFPIRYRDEIIEAALRLDLLVEGRVVVELKAVEALGRVHIAQAITYLKLTGLRVCLLINFNTNQLRRGGIRRVIV